MANDRGDPGDGFRDLRLSDLVTFLIVARTGSVTAAAREMKVTPSQASKAMARLEEHCRVKLMTRGPKGMSLSEDGRQIIPHITEAVSALAATSRNGRDTARVLELTLAGPSYLVGAALAAIAEAHPELRLCGMELAPSQIRATLTEGLFDMALSPGGVPGLPPTWATESIVHIRKALVGPPQLVSKLTLPITLEVARGLPFVGPMASVGGRFSPLSDDCPLPMADRRIVHRVQTFGAALELAVRSQCVAFGPLVAARRMIRTGELVEIPVIGWTESERLDLVCNGDVVLDRVRKDIAATLERELARED